MYFINLRLSVLTLFIIPVVIVMVALILGFQSLAAPKPVELVRTPLVKNPVVTYIEGTAFHKSPDSAEWLEVFPGDELRKDSTVRTEAASQLDLRLWTGSLVRLLPETVLEMASLYQESIRLDVNTGGIVAKIGLLSGNQDFTIHTPTAVAGIRGTQLAVRMDGQATGVFGLSGKIAVALSQDSDREVLLGAHEKSSVLPGAQPQTPAPMSPDEIAYYQNILDSLRETIVFLVSDRIKFEPDSVILTQSSELELSKIYLLLRDRDLRIRIIGHSANLGPLQEQIDISRQRAQAVKDYLVAAGIPASRLETEGVGGSRPLTDKTDPASLESNRRVEFVVVE